eukprot:932078-Rhodomonas_salina.1
MGKKNGHLVLDADGREGEVRAAVDEPGDVGEDGLRAVADDRGAHRVEDAGGEGEHGLVVGGGAPG